MNWATLFERAPAGITVEEIRTTLAEHRDNHTNVANDDHTNAPSDPQDPSQARIVADADVLAADLLVGADARHALEPIWQHDWTHLVGSDQLLDDAQNVIETLSNESLAADWREQIELWREPVSHPVGDQPALASAYRGGAMHVLSFTEQLTSSQAGASLNDRFPVSIRQPDAFAFLFDPESVYPTVSDGPYSGPDRTPREQAN